MAEPSTVEYHDICSRGHKIEPPIESDYSGPRHSCGCPVRKITPEELKAFMEGAMLDDLSRPHRDYWGDLASDLIEYLAPYGLNREP